MNNFDIGDEVIINNSINKYHGVVCIITAKKKNGLFELTFKHGHSKIAVNPKHFKLYYKPIIQLWDECLNEL